MHCLVYDKFGKEHEERTGFEAILALYCGVCQFDFTEPYKKKQGGTYTGSHRDGTSSDTS